MPSPARSPAHIIEAACRCVGYADPYGLCGGRGEPPCKEATWAVMGASGGAAIAVGGCTLSTGGVCLLATPAVAAIGGTGGALVGGLAGKIADNSDAITTLAKDVAGALPTSVEMGKWSRRLGTAGVIFGGWLGGIVDTGKVGESDHTTTGAGGPTKRPEDDEDRDQETKPKPTGSGQ